MGAIKFKRMRETNVSDIACMTGASRYCPEQGIESMKKISETKLRFAPMKVCCEHRFITLVYLLFTLAAKSSSRL